MLDKWFDHELRDFFFTLHWIVYLLEHNREHEQMFFTMVAKDGTSNMTLFTTRIEFQLSFKG
jgi:hypothetical protein